MRRRDILPVLLLLIAWMPLAAGEAASDEGSLLVLVLSGADDVPLPGAVVEVVDLESVTIRPGSPPRQPKIVGRGTTDEKGWATIDGLPAGGVVLRILPAGRKYPHVTNPVEIARGERTVLDEVVVPPPSELVVHFDVSESLGEHLREGRFKLKVFASSGDTGLEQISLESKDTTATFAEVPPGKWRLTTTIVTEKPYVADKNQVEVEVPPGTRIDVTIPVEGLLFVGTLMHRGEPVAAYLNLRPAKMSPDDWGFAASTDEKGRFGIPLRRAGSWRMLVRSKDPQRKKMLAEVPAVEFRERDARGEMVIELPEGAIAGRVIDADGNGVRSTVRATLEQKEPGPRTTAVTPADDDGEFTLDVLVAGNWMVTASSEKLAGDPLPVTVAEDEETGGVILVLSRKKRVLHIATADGKPLGRVQVFASTLRPGSPAPDRSATVPGEDGVAGIDLPGRDGAPVAIVVAGGEVVSPFLIPLADEMRVILDPPGATLRFAPRDGRDERILVHEEGSFFELQGRVPRPRIAGKQHPAEIQVRPGMWQLVIADTPDKQQRLYAGLGWSLDAITRFHAPAGVRTDVP